MKLLSVRILECGSSLDRSGMDTLIHIWPHLACMQVEGREFLF
ncbi:MAG: hypothetical protein ABI234_18925 [Ktedonobacteraceae bacterium]